MVAVVYVGRGGGGEGGGEVNVLQWDCLVKDTLNSGYLSSCWLHSDVMCTHTHVL